MSQSKTIENLAIAFYRADHKKRTWKLATEVVREFYRDLARTAAQLLEHYKGKEGADVLSAANESAGAAVPGHTGAALSGALSGSATRQASVA